MRFLLKNERKNKPVMRNGLSTLGHSGFQACGDGSLELSLKQEKECLEN